MRKSIIAGGIAGALALGGGVAFAQGTAVVDESELGYVQSAFAGNLELELSDVPPEVLHSAQVAFKDGVITSAQLDKDDTLAVYEVQGNLGGQALEADIRPDGKVEELEVTIQEYDIPRDVRAYFRARFPEFDILQVEQSIRPTDIGLSEVWYEFSGDDFDVEVNSNANSYLVEPA